MIVRRAAWAALALAILPLAPASASARSAPARAKPRPHAALQSLDLYSLRARRRTATILQLKLLELRELRLERVRKVIERQLDPATLFDDRPAPERN